MDYEKEYKANSRSNGGIVLEDFNGGEGFYKINLAYLNKKQVEEIEELVRTWNKDSKAYNDNIKSCIGMCLTDADEQRFKDYNTSLKEVLAWLEKQSKENMIEALRLEYEKGKADALQDQRKEWTSEDLLNRNEIMDILQEYNRDDLIDWLEKQKNTIPDECVFRPVAGCDIESAAKQAIKQQGILAKEVVLAFNGAYIPVKGKAQDIIVNEYNSWLEKQGEKTVIGKGSNSASVSDGDTSVTSKEVVSHPTTSTTFKPKFKVGDFIMNDYCMGRVVKLTNDAYLLDTEQGIPFSYEHNAHLWSIKDAEDGDIIYIKRCKNDSEWLLIFKKIKSQNNYIDVYDYYAFSVDTNNVYHDFNGWWGLLYDGDIVCPATKEQCNLLLQKMKEEGYEWDAEKKELKLLITNGGDFESENCEQNPAWSEEDDSHVRGILSVLQIARSKALVEQYKDSISSDIDWLESIKQRIGG